MVWTSSLSYSGLKPPGNKNSISCTWVEGEPAPSTVGIHETYCWEMNHFPIRKCNRTEVSCGSLANVGTGVWGVGTLIT